MKKLSIIIVNYNVQFFLEQALLSVRKAGEGIDHEVFVVDNNSVDDSVKMIRDKFPEVKLIVSKENLGFSKANNIAIAQAKGEYILLLNPDTVVREDTFHSTVKQMDEDLQIGALGVKMIDGKGKFLPESKRGFPSPEVAFYKTFGLSKLFPKSKRFNHYHLGYLSSEENHEVEVLSGAFMLLRKEVIDKIGVLDESFFMYGEDIDLSYRVIQAGYKNYYFAGTTIIHYKGESTKKGSLNYVKTFYQAMIIFARKHFGGQKAGIFIAMLNASIYLRALITILSNFIRKAYLPFFDALLIFLGLFLAKDIWSVLRFHDPHYFKASLLYFNFPLYILIWLIVLQLRGAYDRFYRINQIIGAIFIGSLCISAIYGFLPSHLRASRMLIVFGSFWAILSTLTLRSFIGFVKYGKFSMEAPKKWRTLIIGSWEECKRVQDLIYQAGLEIHIIGFISTDEIGEGSQNFIGVERQLDEIVPIYQINELIFCAQDMSAEKTIYWMNALGEHIQYKIVPKDSISIIGSNSKDSAGDLYTVDINFKLNKLQERRNKRILDLGLSLLFLILSPFLIWFSIRKTGVFYRNIWRLIIGKNTWVGYHKADDLQKILPKLKPCILNPLDGLKHNITHKDTIHRLNLLYAKDYNTEVDIEIIQKSWRKIFLPIS